MAPKLTKVTVPLATLLMALTMTPLVGAEILYAETAPMSFEAWAADLAPGFLLKESMINNRLCYCKKPSSSSSGSFSSFNFDVLGPLTSSGNPASSFTFVFLTPPPAAEPNQEIYGPAVNASKTTTLEAAGNPVETTRKGTSTTLEAATSTKGVTATPTVNKPETVTTSAPKNPSQKLTTTEHPTTSSTSTSSTSTSSTSTKPPTTTTSAARPTTPVPTTTTLKPSTTTTKQAPTTTLKPKITTQPASSGGGLCGECNTEVTIDDTNFMDIHEWKTPGWDKGENYPDGCTCTFKAHVRLSQYGYFVYDFAPGSNIKALNNCAHDRLEVNLNGNKDVWCDANMSKYSGGEYTVGVPQDYTFTFISDPADGNQVEKGFSLTIQAYNFGRNN